MSNIEYLHIDRHRLNDIEYLNQHGISTQNIHVHLLVTSSIYFSKNFICLTNPKVVYIYTKERLMDCLVYDQKFKNYLNISNSKEILTKLEQRGLFDFEIIDKIFGQSSSLKVDTNELTDKYLLNHFFKRAAKIELKKVMEDANLAEDIDPKGVMYALLETKLNFNMVYLKLPSGQNILWAYLDIREENGYYYPVLSIVDYVTYVTTREVRYNKYLVPKLVLKNLISHNKSVDVEVTQSDLLPSKQICSRCKFNSLSKVHEDLCYIIYGEED